MDHLPAHQGKSTLGAACCRGDSPSNSRRRGSQAPTVSVGQIRHDRRQVLRVFGGDTPALPLFELFDVDPPLSVGVLQQGEDSLAIRVAYPKSRQELVVGHGRQSRGGAGAPRRSGPGTLGNGRLHSWEQRQPSASGEAVVRPLAVRGAMGWVCSSRSPAATARYPTRRRGQVSPSRPHVRLRRWVGVVVGLLRL